MTGEGEDIGQKEIIALEADQNHSKQQFNSGKFKGQEMIFGNADKRTILSDREI
jgi:hypothetical protein